jgi:hypothetical protein
LLPGDLTIKARAASLESGHISEEIPLDSVSNDNLIDDIEAENEVNILS